jgi:Zn-dependent protease
MSSTEPQPDLSEGTHLALEAIEAPAAGAAPAAPPIFYRLNPNKLTKVLGLRVPCSSDDPCVEHLGDFEVPESKVPQIIRDRLAPRVAELTALGFQTPIYHSIDDFLHKTGTFLASFAHPSLPVIARIHQRIWAQASPAKIKVYVEFITAYSDGGFLWTLGGKKDMAAPPVCRTIRLEKASTVQLWERHQQERVKDTAFRKALPASTPDQVAVICEHMHDVVREFHVGRGVFAPLSKSDQQDVTATRQLFQNAVSGQSANPDVMVELDKLLAPRTSWLATIVILAISLGVFMAVRPAGTSTWLGMLGIVGVIFFHELGHYVTMRLCGYKNLRMFFIPGFGGAVSGHAFNVPGWKRVIVALMGPMPGIILGIVVGLCGIAFKRDLAVGAGLLLVAINGFNLLPVFPLDGGRVLHAILFSRHYILDVVFRVLTLVVFIILSAAGGIKAGIFVSVGLVMTIPVTIRTAQIAKKLKQEGISPTSPDNQTIPRDVADRIITHLKAGAKTPVHNKLLAQQTLQVFETLNTRPPGVLASLSLLTLHGLMLVAAIVFATVFVISRQGSLPNFVRAAANRPQYSLVASEIRTTSAPGAPTPAASTTHSTGAAPTAPAAPSDSGSPAAAPKPLSDVTVVATFFRGSEATQAYEKAAAGLQPGQSATLVGHTLLLRAPASDDMARKQWMNIYQPQAKDLFVHGDAMRASFRIQGIAPTEEAAKDLETKFHEYFDLPTYQNLLVAPWSPSCTVTPQEELARRTYARLSRVRIYDDPQFKALRDKTEAARRAGDGAQVKSLLEDHRKLTDELTRKWYQAVADDPAMDQDMARRYIELYNSAKPDDFYTTAPKEFAPRLGAASLAGPNPDCARAAAHGGWMTRVGLIVQIEYVSFEDPAVGAAAFTHWLASKSVSQLHYEVTGVAHGEEDEEP